MIRAHLTCFAQCGEWIVNKMFSKFELVYAAACYLNHENVIRIAYSEYSIQVNRTPP